MKSLGRLFGLILLGLLVLLVTLGFALTHLIDPNDYKDEIRQLARDKANLELTLNGPIGWSLFPWLGIELHDATLASAATPQQPFADLQLLGLSVRVLPLLRREVQMSDVRIEGLRLNLQRDQQGRGNWEGLGRPAPASAAPALTAAANPAVAGSAAPAKDAARPLQLDIDSLNIRNASIDYADARSGKHYTLENLQLSSGSIRESSAIPFKLFTHLNLSEPQLRGQAELSAKLRFDRQLQRYQLEDAQLSGEVSGEPLQGKTLTFATQGQLLLDQAAGIAEWNSLKLTANQLRALGEIKVYDLGQAPRLSGGLSIAELNLRDFLTGIGVTLPPMADPASLSRFELVSRLGGTLGAPALQELKLKLDDSSSSGQLEITDLTRRAVRLQLKTDHLDLDRYLPPVARDSGGALAAEVKATLASASKQGNSALPAAPTQQAWSESPVFPVERLRQLDLQLDLDFAELGVKKLPLEDASLLLRGKDGLVEISELRGELQGGSFASSSRLDVRPAIPLLDGQIKLSNLPIESLLQISGKPAPIRGRLDLDSQLRSSGDSEKTLIDSLNGTANFQLNDGVLVDANLEQQLCTGIATLNRKTLSSTPRGKDTPFQQLQGRLTINNGVASNPDLQASIPGLAVSGNGDLDLRVLGLDYRLGVIIEGDKGAMPDPACQVSKQFVGIEWPLQCRGPLELGAKACRLDKDGMNKVAGKIVGEKLSNKIDEKLGDKVSPELKDALKGLFNQ
ncbi:AsmA family protein [Pseudomonas sp. N040]|uniref:AsmA family protein n=1 Tax=Pseudomonas sp. N040 TaxID=2785325 RepID=UPI0018A28B8A|nr:AsmA family protein [Pseudomonas sp. N040]MBF7728536.1 AsmA family protein [Pseudomonas sp. N040]MBW7012176.1 AsmA family protein [Pseudomonas sp. N040]